MDDVFESPKSVLANAHHHISDLEAQITAFKNAQPWAYLVEKNAETGQYTHKIVLTQKIPRITRNIVFDIVGNLRSVLDQCGYSAAIAAKSPHITKTHFPFGDDIIELDNNITRRKVCKHLPPEIVTLFRSFRPYKGGNHTLWALNKLCNSKKHCALAPMIAANFKSIVARELGSGPFMPGGPNLTLHAVYVIDSVKDKERWNPDKNELTLMVTLRDVDINPHVTFDVAIDSPEIVPPQPAGGLLRHMASIVESVLMATEAECRRLGFIS